MCDVVWSNVMLCDCTDVVVVVVVCRCNRIGAGGGADRVAEGNRSTTRPSLDQGREM